MAMPLSPKPLGEKLENEKGAILSDRALSRVSEDVAYFATFASSMMTG
jgi:hypothetical protein